MANMMPYGEQPAHPCDVPVERHDGGETKRRASGLTIRDHFAGVALTGLLAAESDSEGTGIPFGNCDKFAPSAAIFAQMAYMLADAMISARDVNQECPF